MPQAVLGEGPIWLQKINRLAFVDIEGKRIHIWDPCWRGPGDNLYGRCGTAQHTSPHPRDGLPTCGYRASRLPGRCQREKGD